MAEGQMVIFVLRNGEQRAYNDVTRVDTSRPHTVLVYQGPTLIAQLNKHDVVKHTFVAPSTPDEAAAETPA